MADEKHPNDPLNPPTPAQDTSQSVPKTPAGEPGKPGDAAPTGPASISGPAIAPPSTSSEGNEPKPEVGKTPEQKTSGATAPSASTPAGPEAPPAASPAKPVAVAGAAPAEVKPAAAPKAAVPVPGPWESEMVTRFKERFGASILDAQSYLKQNYFVVHSEKSYEVLAELHDQEGFDYLVDVTALHYPERELQFEVIWILYSFERNERIRVKSSIKEGDKAPTVVPLWSTSNWLEREVFDMFGIEFDGHPDMRRILLPDGWKGYPLRKDYGIIQQDQEWVQINLGIPSGQ